MQTQHLTPNIAIQYQPYSRRIMSQTPTKGLVIRHLFMGVVFDFIDLDRSGNINFNTA